ncbi:MAG: VCBS repeat-containing protein [bacterium]
MTTRLPLILLLVFILGGAAPSVGCGPSATGTSDGGGSGDASGLDAGEDGDGGTCPPGRLICEGACCEDGQWCRQGECCDQENSCGEHCCAVDELCMGGHCHPDCNGGTLCLGANDDEMCCAVGEICFMNQCLAPGMWCDSDADCALTEYCELAIPGCMPIPDSACEYIPPAGDFTPTVEWTWPTAGATTILPDHVDVLAAPAVGDMDGDSIPEVAFVAYQDACAGGGYFTGVLTILRGDTGAEVLRLDDPTRRLASSTAPAMGDIDDDGLPEVIVMRDNYRLLAYELDGTLLRDSEPATVETRYGAIAIADMNGDGEPNIVVGPSIYDRFGGFICSGTAGRGGSAATRSISVAADLDMDGDMELIAGNTAYEHDCSIKWNNTSVGDGYVAIGDLFDASGIVGQDGWPEVVLVSAGSVYVLDGQNGDVLWGPHAIPGSTSSNFGGAPVVADFDDDGLPEIGTAGGANLVVFDPDGPIPVLWQQPTKDTSSAITGCTVFDFEGDGAAEIVYTDECFVRIYRGTDGTILFEDPNNTRTHNEFPIVVDVDGDGSSELLVTSNVCVWGCDTLPGWSGPARRGIKVYGDVQLNWVRTRSIWNQHSYHVTNVNDDGTIPSPEAHNWTQPGLNNYRQNVQTWGVHNAPNMTPALFGADTRQCNVGGSITLGLMVRNEGSKGVPAGVNIGFYRIVNVNDYAFLGAVQTQEPLLPGMIEYVELTYDIPPNENPLPDVFRFAAIVDDPYVGEVAIHECQEDDNEAGPIDVHCDAVQ